jgi:hypothetical protein
MDAPKNTTGWVCCGRDAPCRLRRATSQRPADRCANRSHKACRHRPAKPHIRAGHQRIARTSAPGDVVAGPGRQASLGSFQGLPASQMNDAQQRLLWLLVQEFVRNVDFDAAGAQLALIQETWDETHFAWQGPPPDPTARFYFRVHGPRILIEYDVQEPLTSQGGHVHAITRDPTNDYGMDWLGLHYQEHPRYRVARAVPVVLRAALACRPRNTGLRADDLDHTPVVREFVRRRFGLLLARGSCPN